MPKIYSPNLFYFTFPNGDSWNFDKISNVLKKTDIYSFIQLYDFSSFSTDFD